MLMGDAIENKSKDVDGWYNLVCGFLLGSCQLNLESAGKFGEKLSRGVLGADGRQSHLVDEFGNGR